MVDSFLCRPCRKTYLSAEVQGRRACPRCKGPLISQQQLENYRAETQTTLIRLKDQSTVTLAAGALVAMAGQIMVDWYKNDSDYRALSWLVFAGSVASLVTAGIWWKTGKKVIMLVASVVVQAAALVYAASVFMASVPLMELAEARGVGRQATMGMLAVALTPFGLSLLAWHQYRNYLKILKT